ncbi:MAG TPA: hypothetical protein VM487_13175 [Phycisphaerae bacterium]|nr:hypothetical protein [Phycisphaerae bacterium]
MSTRERKRRRTGEATSMSITEVTGRTESLEDQIRYRAYEVYLARLEAGASGDATSDWFQAEQELRRGSVAGQS